MIDIKILFEQVCVLVLMIIPGVLLKKSRLVDESFGKSVSNLILYAAQPALIIAGFTSVDVTSEILLRMLAVFILGLFSQLLFFVVSKLVFKNAEDSKRRVLIFSTVFTNAGYMGIPLLCAIFEEIHPEIAIYAAVYVTGFNILLWSLGAYLYTDNKNYISVKKMLLNPATLSTFVGILILILSAFPVTRDNFVVPFIRNGGVVPSLINGLKALVAPLAMFIIGFRLVNVKLLSVLKDKFLYIQIVLSLFVLPAIVWGVLKVLALLNVYNDPLTTSVLLISVSAPAATATCMFSEKFDGDSEYAGVIVSVTSILCVISMPVVCLLTTI